MVVQSRTFLCVVCLDPLCRLFSGRPCNIGLLREQWPSRMDLVSAVSQLVTTLWDLKDNYDQHDGNKEEIQRL